MKLTGLYKDPGSGGNGCPTVYLADSGELAALVLGAIERYRESGQR